MKSVISELLDIKLAMDVFFFTVEKKDELWFPASNANLFALFDDKTELHGKICLIAILN